MSTPAPVERDDRSAPFFAGAAAEELVIKTCAACGDMLAPEARTCTACGGSKLEWHSAIGGGSLVTWTVVHRSGESAFTLGYIELAEGPWLSARIVDVDPPMLRAGLPLSVAFVHPDEGDSYPVFRSTTHTPTKESATR